MRPRHPRTSNASVTIRASEGSDMPLYFFNIRNHVDTRDDVGTELTDLEAARVEALKDIVDIMGSRSVALSNHWPEWSIEICDDRQQVLLVVPFSRN
jgi:Domain of unknown function (DUF6894)